MLEEMKPRVVLSVSNFFFALFETTLTYILIPYLTGYMSEIAAGFVIASGALVACAIFPFLPRIVARYGAQQIAIVIAVLEMLSLLTLAIAPGIVAVSIFSALAIGLAPFLAYQLDLLLEATVAEEGITARVRTMFLTAWNVASIAAPLLFGALLATQENYDVVFLAAAATTLPLVVLLAARKLPQGRPPSLIQNVQKTAVCMATDSDFAATTFGHFLLYLFFIWAPFYTPFYLHQVIGIPWSELGWIFAIMLLPYVLIEYPAGILADKIIGDKEMMFMGFLIAGASLAAIGLFTPATPLAVIVAVLVMSRVGAALIESMTEGHFFRRVTEQDVNSISIFRGIWPLATLGGPIVASVILIFSTHSLFFIITGSFIAIAGMVSTVFVRDFR
jgi:MFS family permease